jgi:pilin isopeptide linkage protein
LHSRSKKWIANITVILMILTLIPATAFAASSTTWSQAGYDNVSQTWTPGNIVKYYEGSYVPYRANAEGYVPTGDYVDFDLEYRESGTGALGYDQATDWFIGPSVPYTGSPTLYTKADINKYAQDTYKHSIIDPNTQFMGADAFIVAAPVELTSGGLTLPSGYTGDTILRYHVTPNLLGYTSGSSTAAADSFINALMTWYGGNWTMYYKAHLAESGAPNLFEGGTVTLGAGAYTGSSLHVTFSQGGAKSIPLPTKGLAKKDILVEKTWANNNDSEPVTINLIGQKGEAGTPYIAATITLDGTVDSNTNPEYAAWKGKFVNVPIYYTDGPNVFPITYSISEDPVPTGFLPPVYGGNANDGFTVHNAYSTAGSGNVAITKELTGDKTLAADMFGFTITQTNSSWIATNGGYTETVKNLADGTVPFSAIDYTAAGTYYYVIQENAGSLDGITYDTDTIKVTMTVTYDGKGKLTATPSYAGGQTFTNAYNTSGSGNVAITKGLTGDKTLAADMFDFTITQTDSSWNVMPIGYTETVKNLADGTVPFSAINYTGAGTYYYIITEGVPMGGILDGITYDTDTIKVTMTVTDDGKGKLTATPSYEGGQAFTNAYNTSGSGDVDITKELTGDKALAADMFDFTITQTDSNWIATNGGYTETVKNLADGTVPFSAIDYTAAGTYYYVIQENAGSLGGITYDTDTIKVTMTVTDDGKGKLTATPSYEGGQTFTNAYNTSGSGNVAITKELTGDKALAADMFDFTITQTDSNWIATNGGYTETVKNLADGTVPFSAIDYTAAGTYYYVIQENAGSLGGITYDTDTIKVTMTVTDDGKGKLTATPSYESGQTFTNAYNTSGSGNVAITKELTGMELTADMFSFTITQTGTESGTPYTETVKNLADGTVPFSAIDYTSAGTYTYEITEDAPSTAIPGITYDTNTIKVTMTVTDDGKGNLTATPSYDGGQAFTNSYEGPGKITVTKKVVVLTDDETIKVNYSFYAALFEQQEGQMVRVSDIQKLDIVDSNNAVATFDKLNLDKTYYVFETDSEGNIIQTEADGTIVTPIIPDWTQISYDNAVVTLTLSNMEGETTITNVFVPEDFPLLGSITVNKQVTVNGKLFASNRTFYVALFADKALTDMVSEVKTLKMNGNTSTMTEFLTDIDGNPLEVGTTYYIAETDKNGVPLTGTFEQLGFEIDIDHSSVVITEEGTTVNIINKFKSEEFPLTGDNFNGNLWLFLAMIGAAGVLAPFAFRKKEDANK